MSDLSSPLAYVAATIIVLAAATGVVALRHQVRRSRAARAAVAELER